MNMLAARERRLIALALLLALVAVVWLGAVRPLIEGFADRADQRATALEDYARNARMIHASPHWRATARRMAISASAFELAQTGEASALEAARERLARQLAAAGAVVHAIRPQPSGSSSSSSSGSGGVRLRADFQIELAGLMQVLRRVHDQAPSGLVDSLSIASDPAAAAARGRALEVRLDVSYAYAAPI